VCTFITPLLAVTAGVHGVTVCCCSATAPGALGDMLGGRATDRWGAKRPLLTVFAGITVVLAVLPVVTSSTLGAGVILFLWGLCTWSVNPPI
jgi:predicted MFS family arabinose efflux permease